MDENSCIKWLLVKKISAFILALLILFPTAVSAAPRTSTTFKAVSGTGGIEVFPYLGMDRTKITIDFQSSNLANVEYIKYVLNYGLAGQGTTRGAQGTIIPNPATFKYFNRIPYIRQEITLGMCSKNACVYDPNAKNFNITVETKLKNNKKVETKAYNIN
jgi:hypothetical protein